MRRVASVAPCEGCIGADELDGLASHPTGGVDLGDRQLRRVVVCRSEVPKVACKRVDVADLQRQGWLHYFRRRGRLSVRRRHAIAIVIVVAVAGGEDQ
jgi:hypothetical protein